MTNKTATKEKRPDIPQHVRRQWFLASVLHQWQTWIGREVRKGYGGKAYWKNAPTDPMALDPEQDAIRIEVLMFFREKCEHWIAAVDSVLAESEGG